MGRFRTVNEVDEVNVDDVVPFVVCGVVDGDDIRVHGVGPRGLLVLGAHEIAETALVVGSAVIEQIFGHTRVFVHDCHVQNVLT